MLVYKITLLSYKTGLVHDREVYVDSPTKEKAESRLIRTFDNLVNLEYLRKDNLPGNGVSDNFNIQKVSIAKQVIDFLSDKNYAKVKDITIMFGIPRSYCYAIFRRLGFKYNSVTKLFERN